jgi:hypothetical protein
MLPAEHQLYRLAFAESSSDRQWDRVTFCEDSAFSSANDGPILVYMPREERCNCQYVSIFSRSDRIC